MATDSADLKLLLDAASEIQNLRRRCEILSAQVETMQIMDRMMRANVPRIDAVMGPDLVWQIIQRTDELAHQLARQAAE